MAVQRSFLLLGGLVLFGAIPDSWADVYYGTKCWQAKIVKDVNWNVGATTETATPISSGSEVIFKVGVYQKEGGSFVFYGKAFTDNMTTVVPVHGNGEINADSILGTLVATGISGTDTWEDVTSIVLNLQSLNGDFSMIGNHYTTQGKLGIHYEHGSMTQIACP